MSQQPSSKVQRIESSRVEYTILNVILDYANKLVIILLTKLLKFEEHMLEHVHTKLFFHCASIHDGTLKECRLATSSGCQAAQLPIGFPCLRYFW